jgi:UDP-xylose/UDP-N-acetylglucosamine transporter B4
MYFIVSVVNNAALGFNISMPLHMIFRAVKSTLCNISFHSVKPDLLSQGSLMANMVLGMIILNKVQLYNFELTSAMLRYS